MTGYPDELREHLDGAVTTVCACWRLTRKDGWRAGFTDHDLPLVFDGTSFEPQSGFGASEARETLGLSVDTVDVEGVLSSDHVTDADIAAGLYDGAKVETFLVNWREPGQFAPTRVATIGKVTRTGERFVAELESQSHRLDQPGGRRITRNCDAELGDARCRFALGGPTFEGSGIVLSAQTPDSIAIAGLSAFKTGWFSCGTLRWTTGKRAGRTERVVDHRIGPDGALLTLQPSVGPAIDPGDAFQIVAGCDKTFATCKSKFGNALNFRGFPHLPGNDMAYSYVAEGGVFDGKPVVP